MGGLRVCLLPAGLMSSVLNRVPPAGGCDERNPHAAPSQEQTWIEVWTFSAPYQRYGADTAQVLEQRGGECDYDRGGRSGRRQGGHSLQDGL